MTLLPEEKLLDLYGRKVLIMRGDTLAPTTRAIWRFARKVHNPWIQRLFLALPLFIPPPYRRQNARRQQSGQQQQVDGDYGCQSAGGS